MKKTMCILAVLTMSMVMVSCGSKEYREVKGELKSLIKEVKNAKSEDELDKIDSKAWDLAKKTAELDISDKEDKAIDKLIDELDKEYAEKKASFND